MQRGDESAATPAASAPRKSPANDKSPAPIELDGLGIMKSKREKPEPKDAATLAEARAMTENYLALSAKLDYEQTGGNARRRSTATLQAGQ